jgi:hypothetical protein
MLDESLQQDGKSGTLYGEVKGSGKPEAKMPNIGLVRLIYARA